MTHEHDMPGLAPAEAGFLLRLARAVVTAAAEGRTTPDPERFAAESGFDPTPALRAERGAFVTLTRSGRLRGCIGTIEGIMPLMEAVAENALAATCRDPRFLPVTADELDGLGIEVSVLSPLRSVGGPDEIRIGRHGILLTIRGARAVFLPQVATEQGWDLVTTLDNLAQKAGRTPGAWREEGTEFQVFTAEILEEQLAE